MPREPQTLISQNTNLYLYYRHHKSAKRDVPTTLAKMIMKSVASIVVDARELLTGIQRVLRTSEAFRSIAPSSLQSRGLRSLEGEALAMVADVLATVCTSASAMTRAEAVHSLGKLGFEACASQVSFEYEILQVTTFFPSTDLAFRCTPWSALSAPWASLRGDLWTTIQRFGR